MIGTKEWVESIPAVSSYNNIRSKTVQLCLPLETEDFVVQPVTYVSPPKWHLGHTTWFYENFILLPYKAGYKPFNKNYNYLFNSYYDSVGERVSRPERGHLTRPTTEQVLAYRKYVDEQMKEFLGNEKNLNDKVRTFLQLGLNHEQQHQELLITDIKYILGINPLFPGYLKKEKKRKEVSVPEKENFLEIPEGIYEIGYSGKDFCFDNEKHRHKVFLNAYKILDRLVTNREYLEFMQDGGYEDFKYWLSEGWEWVIQNGVKAPLYWHYQDNAWHNFTLYGLKELELDEPVTHINYYEAEAFASWKGKRLPTEAEWEIAAGLQNPEILNDANLADKANYHPMVRAGARQQWFGDAWEWTGSAYLPYPGYKQESGALGEYNGKFMINQMVLKGGSCVTPRDHIRHSYRNFFHPELRWQFTGIRIVETI